MPLIGNDRQFPFRIDTTLLPMESAKGFDNLVEEVSQFVTDAFEKKAKDDDVTKLSEDLQKKLQLLKTEARKFTQRQVQEVII